MPQRVMLIINPSSGEEEAPKYGEAAKVKLAAYFDEVTVRETEKGGDATRFAREAAEDGYDSVIVMGGDGTVNEGINGLVEQPDPPRFGFFPMGTVNDMARALDIPLDPEEAIASFDPSRTVPMDVGAIQDRYFMNVVAIGAIPEAVNETSVEDKTRFGKWAYIADGIRAFFDDASYTFTLTLDGEVRTVETSLILIASSNSVGGFEGILPDAAMNDGLLHMIYLKDRSAWERVRALPELLKGIAEDDEKQHVGFENFREATIEVEADAGTLHLNVDGDEAGSLPAHVRVLPHALEVYCGPNPHRV